MQSSLPCGVTETGLLSALPSSVTEDAAETEQTIAAEGDSGKRPASDEVRLQERMLISSISSAHLGPSYSGSVPPSLHRLLFSREGLFFCHPLGQCQHLRLQWKISPPLGFVPSLPHM